MLPYSYWALTCNAALPTYSAFMISVRQASDLPPASFRFPVTWDTLALGYILPAVGRIRDFHPLKHAPAGRTSKRREASNLLLAFSISNLIYKCLQQFRSLRVGKKFHDAHYLDNLGFGVGIRLHALPWKSAMGADSFLYLPL